MIGDAAAASPSLAVACKRRTSTTARRKDRLISGNDILNNEDEEKEQPDATTSQAKAPSRPQLEPVKKISRGLLRKQLSSRGLAQQAVRAQHKQGLQKLHSGFDEDKMKSDFGTLGLCSEVDDFDDEDDGKVDCLKTPHSFFDDDMSTAEFDDITWGETVSKKSLKIEPMKERISCSTFPPVFGTRFSDKLDPFEDSVHIRSDVIQWSESTSKDKKQSQRKPQHGEDPFRKGGHERASSVDSLQDGGDEGTVTTVSTKQSASSSGSNGYISPLKNRKISTRAKANDLSLLKNRKMSPRSNSEEFATHEGSDSPRSNSDEFANEGSDFPEKKQSGRRRSNLDGLSQVDKTLSTAADSEEEHGSARRGRRSSLSMSSSLGSASFGSDLSSAESVDKHGHARKGRRSSSIMAPNASAETSAIDLSSAESTEEQRSSNKGRRSSSSTTACAERVSSGVDLPSAGSVNQQKTPKKECRSSSGLALVVESAFSVIDLASAESSEKQGLEKNGRSADDGVDLSAPETSKEQISTLKGRSSKSNMTPSGSRTSSGKKSVKSESKEERKSDRKERQSSVSIVTTSKAVSSAVDVSIVDYADKKVRQSSSSTTALGRELSGADSSTAEPVDESKPTRKERRSSLSMEPYIARKSSDINTSTTDSVDEKRSGRRGRRSSICPGLSETTVPEVHRGRRHSMLGSTHQPN